jgi:integrase
MRWHDLRHVCSILLHSRSTQSTLVQYLLGHASLTMTFHRYSQWKPLMGRHTATAMEEALG